MGGLCSREVTTAAVRPTPVEVLRQENTLLEDNLSHASTNGGAAGFSDDPPAEDAASTEQDSGAAQGKIEIQCVEKTAAGAEAVPSRGAEAAGDAPLRFQCSIVSVASVMAYDSEIGEGINDLHIVPDEESSDSEEEESSKASLSQPILVEEDEDVLTNAVLLQLYCDLSDNRNKD
eukprot:g1783.t1